VKENQHPINTAEKKITVLSKACSEPPSWFSILKELLDNSNTIPPQDNADERSSR